LRRKNETKILLQKLINKYPKIISGRKNFNNYQKKINKMMNLVKKYSKKTNIQIF
tara:strand:+ start:162 stop:326 length:165 start_codon:yes stop_codon:yes gene_type:complete